LFTAGDKASFDCVVEADPSAVVTWLKDNRPLDDKLADRIRISEQGKIHKLDMLNCRLEDTGLYTARAVNSDGSTTCSAHLIVQTRKHLKIVSDIPQTNSCTLFDPVTPEERDKMAETNSPVFLVKLHDTEVIEGASVRFMIKVKGEPVPDAELYKKISVIFCNRLTFIGPTFTAARMARRLWIRIVSKLLRIRLRPASMN